MGDEYKITEFLRFKIILRFMNFLYNNYYKLTIQYDKKISNLKFNNYFYNLDSIKIFLTIFNP